LIDWSDSIPVTHLTVLNEETIIDRKAYGAWANCHISFHHKHTKQVD